jgi:hypothetical protein
MPDHDTASVELLGANEETTIDLAQLLALLPPAT